MQAGNRPALEIRTDNGSRFYEVFIATRPELMKPEFARQRTSDAFYSSRSEQGLLPATNGRALFLLPDRLIDHFRNGQIHFMVKTFRDESGNGPAVSPVMSTTHAPLVAGVDPSEDIMHGALDHEELLADLRTAPSQRNGGARAASVTAHGVRARATTHRPVPDAGIAAALGLFAARMQAVAAADPAIPGRPSRRDVTRILSHCIAEAKLQDGTSAARAMSVHARSTRRNAARQLEREVNQAIAEMSQGDGRSREMFLGGLLSALGPVLSQLLPQILPVVLPMLQQLLAGAAAGQPAKAKSASASRNRRDPLYAHYGLTADGTLAREQFAFLAPLLGLLPSLLPSLAGLLPGILGMLKGQSVNARSRGLNATGTAGGTVTGTVAPAGGTAAVTPNAGTGGTAVSGNVAPAGAAALDPAKLMALLQALKGAPAAGGAANTAAGGAVAMPAMDPEALKTLLGAMGGAGGINAIAGGPGHELVKSVVDRLPIEKMFDGRAWIPEIKHDEWIQTLPWDKVLSLSTSASVVGTLFVPGRNQLSKLENVQLDIVDQTLTRIAQGKDSWVFVADAPARIRVRVASKNMIDRPFVDVRVSTDGTSQGGLHRSVFRLGSLGPDSTRTFTIEIPPGVLARAPRNGAPTCLSIRLVEEVEPAKFRAAELRATFHVVARHTLVPQRSAMLRERVPDLKGLDRRIPAAGLDGVSTLAWSIDVVCDGAALGEYAPVTRHSEGDDVALDGGIRITPLGIADLARRASNGALRPDDTAAIEQALRADSALCTRLSLRTREMITGARSDHTIRTELGLMPTMLVTFTGISPDGNPTGRQVREVRLPVPMGVSVRAA